MVSRNMQEKLENVCFHQAICHFSLKFFLILVGMFFQILIQYFLFLIGTFSILEYFPSLIEILSLSSRISSTLKKKKN